jgi:hypothetical protein
MFLEGLRDGDQEAELVKWCRYWKYETPERQEWLRSRWELGFAPPPPIDAKECRD